MAILSPAISAFAGTLDQPYIDPAFLTAIPFGGNSQWIQPWRGYLETVPAETFIRAIGVNYSGSASDKGENPELIAEMLARHGMTNDRVEAGWGGIDYNDETKIDGGDRFRDALRRLVRHGLRPMILLNSHHGVPCPCKLFQRKVTVDATEGDRTVELDSVDGLIVGRSGLSQLTDYWAAEALITRIDGHTVTLSKPLPKAIAKGTLQAMATLKYRPFGSPDSPETAETLAAWQRYVLTVTRHAVEALGTENASDKGFDLEVWNELTFGSNFLIINKYYEPKFANYREDWIFSGLVAATANVVKANSQLFSGVKICDGFANTIPWPASSLEPPQVSALSHHPYIGAGSYPADGGKGVSYNALMKAETAAQIFIPTYTTWFPEHYGTLLQTEHAIRDTAPITTQIYGTKHGRFARDPVTPFGTWFTETGMAPNEAGIKDRQTALDLKARTAARTYCFWINKGVTKLLIFGACEGDLSLGVVQDNFIDYAKTHSNYPADDSAYVSAMLRVLGRIAAKMRDGLDPSLHKTVALHVDSISDDHDHVQFVGDGTAQHPNLFDRDVLTILPFQVNNHRLLIAYYVMTRDVRKQLPAEDFTVQLSGLAGVGATVAAYDPLNDSPVNVRPIGSTANSLKLLLPATDYPFLLSIELPVNQR